MQASAGQRGNSGRPPLASHSASGFVRGVVVYIRCIPLSHPVMGRISVAAWFRPWSQWIRGTGLPAVMLRRPSAMAGVPLSLVPTSSPSPASIALRALRALAMLFSGYQSVRSLRRNRGISANEAVCRSLLTGWWVSAGLATTTPFPGTFCACVSRRAAEFR